MESSEELVQQGRVPGSKGALCEEDSGGLHEHLVKDRDGLGPPDLAAIHRLLGESEVFSVIQTQGKGDSLHLIQEHDVLIAEQIMVQSQVAAQRPTMAMAEHHQGRKEREHEGHGEMWVLLAWLS